MKRFYKIITSFFLMLTCIISSMLFVSCGKDKDGDGDNSPQTSTPQLVTVEVSNYQEFKQAVKGTADIIKFKNDIDIRTDTMNPKDFFVFERKVKLDLNGKKLFSTQNIYDDQSLNRAMIEISTGAEVTITGNGQVISNEDDAYAIQIVNGGKVIIENGEFVGNRKCISVHYGSLEIKGGKFSLLQQDYHKTYDPGTGLSGSGYVIDCYDAHITLCSIVIKGGDFVNFDPKNNLSNGVGTNYLTVGYNSTLHPDSTESYKIYRVS